MQQAVSVCSIHQRFCDTSVVESLLSLYATRQCAAKCQDTHTVVNRLPLCTVGTHHVQGDVSPCNTFLPYTTLSSYAAYCQCAQQAANTCSWFSVCAACQCAQQTVNICNRCVQHVVNVGSRLSVDVLRCQWAHHVVNVSSRLSVGTSRCQCRQQAVSLCITLSVGTSRCQSRQQTVSGYITLSM